MAAKECETAVLCLPRDLTSVMLGYFGDARDLLMAAVAEKCVNLVIVLLKYVSDAVVYDVFYAACKLGHHEQAAMVVGKVPKAWLSCTMVDAVQAGYTDLVKLMFAHGADCHDVAFRKACEFGQLPILHVLIADGSNFDWDTGLCLAAHRGHTQVMELMCEKGAQNFDTAAKMADIGNHTHTLNAVRNAQKRKREQ